MYPANVFQMEIDFPGGQQLNRMVEALKNPQRVSMDKKLVLSSK